MSRFYGTVKAERGEATRCGHRYITTHAASWAGAIRVIVYPDPFDPAKERFQVEQVPWHGAGTFQTLAEGIMGEKA